MTEPGNIEKSDKDNKRKALTSIFLVMTLFMVCLTLVSAILIGDHTRKTTVQRPSSIIVAGEDEEEAAPIQIGGRVTYADGTPMANASLELHSVVQKTTSDENGWFFFQNAKPVCHELFVVDEQGQTMASVILDLRLDKQNNGFDVTDMEDGRVNIALSSDVFYIEMDVTMDARAGSLRITPAFCYAVSQNGQVYTKEGSLDVSKGITILPSGTVINQQSEVIHYPVIIQKNNLVIEVPKEGITLSDGTVVTSEEIKLRDGTSVTPVEKVTQTELPKSPSANSGSAGLTGEAGYGAGGSDTLNDSHQAADSGKSQEELPEESASTAPENQLPSNPRPSEEETSSDRSNSGSYVTRPGGGGGGSNNGNHNNNNETNNNETSNDETSSIDPTGDETTSDESSSETTSSESTSSEPTTSDPISPSEEPLNLAVSGEDRTGTWNAWVDNEQIDLFYHQNDGISTEEIPLIRPGSSGWYSFDLVNNGKGSLSFTIRMTEDTIHLPFRFRLFQVTEGAENLMTDWTTPMTRGHSVLLLEEQPLSPGARASYRMEWEWPYETGIPGDDENDTAAAGKETVAERTYFLNMNIYAEGM